jgi:L-glyceraldehyde 3-phosphate reductase
VRHIRDREVQPEEVELDADARDADPGERGLRAAGVRQRRSHIPIAAQNPRSQPWVRMSRRRPRRRSRLAVMTYVAADGRYERMVYRRTGRSGLDLPAISLGLWHNFGDGRPWETQREICRRAFDLGITHFDLANNYGPPYGSAEVNFGRILRADLDVYRDELVISTKAGYDMWPGPYGDRGSRKYLTASLDQSLKRMGLDYVDIFYSHRFDPDTPLEETLGALDSAVRAGKALYVGISSYSAEKTSEAAAILRDLGTPLLIHQPSYSMFNRWIEQQNLLGTLEHEGVGCIAFSPLAQGLLTDRYLNGIPDDSRVATGGALDRGMLSEENLQRVRALNAIAERRGQTLSQLALAWSLRDPRMTSVLIGVSSVKQLENNVAALDRLDFTDDELTEIERYATESHINIWSSSSEE